MTRLNKEMRAQIVQNAVDESGYTARHASLTCRRAKLADDVRLLSIGGINKERELDDQFKALKNTIGSVDKAFFSYLDYVSPVNHPYIKVNFAGCSVQLYFNGYDYYNRDCKAVYKNYARNAQVNIAADSPLNDEFDAIVKDDRELDELKDRITAEVTAVLGSVNTVKQLLNVWPEAVHLLPDARPEPSTSLAVSVDGLNSMLNLPK